MEAHTVLLELLVVLVAARLIGEFAAHAGIPSVIGELVAGILIGPSLLGAWSLGWLWFLAVRWD